MLSILVRNSNHKHIIYDLNASNHKRYYFMCCLLCFSLGVLQFCVGHASRDTFWFWDLT
jgi:TM2 domain-containing membrane protein YozV